MTVALVWFRRNLRLADNAALVSAIEQADAVVPVFVRSTIPAEHGPGIASRAWLDRSLESLDSRLKARGSSLVVRTGRPTEELARLAESCSVRAVWCERDWTPDGLAEEEAVRGALASLRMELHTAEGQLLVTPTQLATAQGNPYRVFTPFWRAWRRAWAPDEPLAAPGRVPAPTVMPAPSGSASTPTDGPDITRWWTVGEPAAVKRLDEFSADGLGEYDSLRDRPALHATSELSARLAWGEISPRAIARTALSAAGEAAEPFLRQLAWREFSYHLLHHNPMMISAPLRAEFADFPWCASADDLEAWQRGMTGYPLVDAGMRQLIATGWMHNRVRLVAASFLTKDLLGRWQDGEAHFREQLADYDPAANAFNWQWVAGSGADAAPYFRIFNPTVQGARFDPDGEYVRTWVPELARLEPRWIHRPWDAPQSALVSAGIELGNAYPFRIVDHADARDRALAAYAAVRGASPPLV